MFNLEKMSLIITTRCNRKCKLCCEYVPQYKPFPDMTLEDERIILDSFFDVVDHVVSLHLTGGGEPFLHPQLPEMIELACDYKEKFDKLLILTNSTIEPNEKLCAALVKHRDKTVVHASDYGIDPEREKSFYTWLEDNQIPHRVAVYHEDSQYFGGWVDYGAWEPKKRSEDELSAIFRNCPVTRVMSGNWRTRDGKIHWCSRSQRGLELGLLPDEVCDYVDILDNTLSREEKRAAFRRIEKLAYLKVCDWCSGDPGTEDQTKRHKAAEQI